MFERLAGKLLSRLLSKYFVSEDAASNCGTSTAEKKSWSQLGVWSGYVSLEGLELRKEVVNSYLKSKGLPFELLHCTLGRVEITVPWAKLGLTSSSATAASAAADQGDDAFVVVVVDGVQALMRVNYEFDDEALREAAVQERRQELQDAQLFGKAPDKASYSTGMSEFVQKRLTEGILKDILEKLHLHVRDVHVRLEDVQSDQVNPCAVGVTFESLHVQADEITSSPVAKEESHKPTSGVIRKVAQLNHFVVYWNALDYGQGLPTELSVLHDTMSTDSSAAVAAALDRCITRRATSFSSPLRARPVQATPNHSFLLRPLDASWHIKLSTNPSNLEDRPALETSLQIDDLSLQLRDYQCSQISILASAVKEHSFTKDYRKYRPSVSPKEDPRAWWTYACRVIRMELLKGNMRWSWSRFSQRYALRRRYCELYERERRYQLGRDDAESNHDRQTRVFATLESTSSFPSQDSVSELSSAVPDEGAALCTETVSSDNGIVSLSGDELNELTEMEDGIRGDLSVQDIILFRALVNARVAADKATSAASPKSRLRRMMSSFVSEDMASEEEYERLLAYIEQAKATQESSVGVTGASLVAVSIHVNLNRGCISLFSPLPSTEDLGQHRRIQQRFLDLSISKLQCGYSLFGTYESSRLQVSLHDFIGSEIRSNRSVYTILSRIKPGGDVDHDTHEVGSEPGTPQTSNVNGTQKELASLDLHQNPLDCPDCDVRLHVSIQGSQVSLLPDGEWFHKVKKLVPSNRSSRSLASFWEDIGMVQINLLTSKRAGILAKANTAIFTHKNVDMDVSVRCPLLRFSDGLETALMVDLGRAHFVTERLAGMANAKLLVSAMKNAGDSCLQAQENGEASKREGPSCMSVRSSTDCGPSDSSIGGVTPVMTSRNEHPSSPRHALGDSFFLGDSAMSVMGENQMSTRSFYGDIPFSADQGGEYPKERYLGLHSSFYDEFRLEVSGTQISISSGNDSGRSSLVDNMDVQLLVAKSVIPSDHTLCRLRTQCSIKDISVRLSDSSISSIIGLARPWVRAFATADVGSMVYRPSVSAREHKMAVRLGLPLFRDIEGLDLRDTFSDASSMLDESEFIDALEGDDNDESAENWFEDSWIADAESVVDSDIRSVSKRKSQRRKVSMMSDVSSISEKSLGAIRRRQNHHHYLSAENLARLEELVAEEEDSESDADSFQSALSLGGQRDLANEMEEHVNRAEEEVRELKARLAAEAKFSDGSPFLIPEARRRSQVRKSLRVDLERARAELRALRATREDLLSRMESADILHYDEQLESNLVTGRTSESRDPLANELNARAKALVRARKDRASSSEVGEDFKHQLTSGLNRELLRASIVVRTARFVVEGVGASVLKDSELSIPCSFEFCTSQFAVGVLLRANESRLTTSIDGVMASMIEGIDEKRIQRSQHLLLGGITPHIHHTSQDGDGAQVVPPEDKVLVLTLGRQEKPLSGHSSLIPPARATKLKIHVGEIEICPSEERVSSLFDFMQRVAGGKMAHTTVASIRNPADDDKPRTYLQRLCSSLNGCPILRRPSDVKTALKRKVEYIDMSCRISSLRLTIGAQDSTTPNVGSLVLTDLGGRFLRGATDAVITSRSQLDVRCNNVQLFDLYRRPSGLELLGCRDPYNPFVRLRMRSQLVPLTYTGGWVVGEKVDATHESLLYDDLAWNMHVGAKLNSVFATLSHEGLDRVKRSAKELAGIFKYTSDKMGDTELRQTETGVTEPSSPATVRANEASSLIPSGDDGTDIPIRWRVDLLAKKLSVLFPSTREINEIDTSHPHLAKGNALLSFSFYSWLQAAPKSIESVFMRSTFSDLSLIRTSDDWPLLESSVVSADVILPQRNLVNASSHLRLSVPESFAWNGSRSASIGGHTGCFDPNGVNGLQPFVNVYVSISPLRFNITAQTGSLVLSVLAVFKTSSEEDETTVAAGSSYHEHQVSTATPPLACFMKVCTESVEVKLLRESERSSSISFADPLSSLVALRVGGSACQDSKKDKGSIEIGELCLYDLSSLPGARVFGINRYEEETSTIFTTEDSKARSRPETMRISINRSREENTSGDVDIHLGHLQCVVLPSFLRSILSFQGDLKALSAPKSTFDGPIEGEDYQRKQKNTELSVPFGLQQLDFQLRLDGFECLLPSRDIFSYIRSRSKEPVNVVAFRWKSLVTGKLTTPSPSSTFDVFSLESFSLTTPTPRHDEGLTANASLSVDDFQVLRTNVKRRPFPRSAAGGPHISPCVFVVHPPSAGEQRITNPFWFKIFYQVAAVPASTKMFAEVINTNGQDDVLAKHHMSQALNVDAGFVDILVYIKQSSGGMNDALRVTIRPILDLLKQQKDEPGVNRENKTNTTGEPSSLSKTFNSATTICSIESRGIQLTCVPGGATRLTESPIAKCKLSHLKVGLGAVALPIDPKVVVGAPSRVSAIERLRQAGLERFGVVEPTISGGPLAHMTLGGWMQAELSASYHNRRLVAWEPFIEPWMFDVRTGVDLVRVFKLSPSPWIGQPASPSSGFMSSIVGDGINEKAGEKIRDIGRLLRSPFLSPAASTSKSGAADAVVSPENLSPSNMSYVMMKSISPRVVASALYPTGCTSKSYSPTNSKVQMSSLNCLPGTNPAKWLDIFGHPSVVSHDGRKESAAVVCCISDSRPLNVNLTGALIENVMGFLGGGNRESIHPVAPHMIRNFTGLTIRFQECLDAEQTNRGELAKRTIVSAGSEIPLSLKRSTSQSCDPHRAYINLELGSFEDTAGRINHHDFEVTSRSRSTTFFYKAAGKIPVDTVGVKKHLLSHQFKRRAEDGSDAYISQDLGYIIVRVDLEGSTKLVSIESPFVLKNNSEVDLLCELRNHGGVSLLWRSLVPRASTPMSSEKRGMDKRKYISLPADLVTTLADSDATLLLRALPTDSSITHESDVPRRSSDRLVPLNVPPPFSDKSVARGILKVFETSLEPLSPARDVLFPANLNTCMVRIGSVSFQGAAQFPSERTNTDKSTAVPEQRMLFFRPPLVVRNHLPAAIAVQARIQRSTSLLRKTKSSTALTSITERFNHRDTVEAECDPSAVSTTRWHNLGKLECGKSLSWTGATATEGVEIRVRLMNEMGEASRKFQDWSTSVVVPSEQSLQYLKKPGTSHTISVGQMAVFDDAEKRMLLSTSLEFGGADVADTDSAPNQDIRWFSRTIAAAPRVVGVFVPFWIIDSTGQDLEFSSNYVVAGQSSRYSSRTLGLTAAQNGARQEARDHLGLAELLDDDKLTFLSAKSSFDVLMIGDKRASRLNMRRRMTRLYDDESGTTPPWCEPVALRVANNTFSDVFVPAPILSHNTIQAGVFVDVVEPLALGARIVFAPERFGGKHGTKLVHISCRYQIVNEMGREIEVLADYGKGIPSCIGSSGRPVPFHFDGTSPIRFRPKEFGWRWSGRFSIRKKRKEVTLRLVHTLKGQVIIAEIEFLAEGKSGGNILVFREALHPPFRIENQTMHAIQFGQSAVLFGAERAHRPLSLDSTILPYHHADFAWDDPDEGRRYLAIEATDLMKVGERGARAHRQLIGRFKLDRVAPGNRLRLADSNYCGEVVADGPTRVVRITDAALPGLPPVDAAAHVSSEIFMRPEAFTSPPSLIELNLSHGLGISIVDWSPQELLYIQLDEIIAEKRIDSSQEKVLFNISCVSVDNQMWVTPFPVLMRMGRSNRKSSPYSSEKLIRRRRNSAVSVSWRRALNAQSGLILLDNFELSTEPVILCVDGFLSERLWKVAVHVMGMRELIGGAVADAQSRDAELCKVLQIAEDRHAGLPSTNPTYRNSFGRDTNEEAFLATTVMATKLRLKPRSESIAILRASKDDVDKQIAAQSTMPKQRNKYYLAKWKISSMQTEISWSGPLPGAVIKFPDIIRPALTFEALPVRLRPFSMSHAYGTTDDLVHDLKSHYLSIWRVVDVLVGLSFRPTFLIRAFIYTWRESCASFFDSMSNGLGDVEKRLIRLSEPSPASWSSSEEHVPIVRFSSQAYQTVVGGSLLATASVFHNTARLASAVSTALRYGGSARNPASSSVRARNPRLFAHVEGNELLVEYVEGENAGKAILSRVRMGRHLGEGYIYHCEGVHVQSFQFQPESASLICMVTSERVFLLNGDRHANFCKVVWECTFLNCVEVEFDEFQDTMFDLVKLWYLVDTAHAKGNTDDRLTRYSKAVTGDADFGLDVLLCKSVFVPKESGAILRSKIASVHRRLGWHDSGSMLIRI